MWQPAPPPEEAPSERKVRMMQLEQERMARRKRRRKRKKKLLAVKKKQIYAQTLRKEVLERHLHRVQEAILNPPIPTSKHAEEEPLDADLDPQFYHPSTFGYHNPRMFRERYDSSVLSPVFFEYPVDHRRARGSLEPAWKRQLNKQQPRPCRVEARHPAMIAYTMHSQRNWNNAIWNPVFHGMKFDSSRSGIEREGPIKTSEEDSSFAVGDTGIVISSALLDRMRAQQEKRKALRRRAKVMAVLNTTDKKNVSKSDREDHRENKAGENKAGENKAGENKAGEKATVTAAEAAAALKHKEGNRFRLRKFMWETRDRMEPCFFCEGAGPAAVSG